MGQYHYLVNLTKRQYVHPHRVGNGFKLREQVGWDYSTSTVLVMLLAASNKGGARGGGDFNSKHPLIGDWAGDRIAFIGDYAEATDIPDFDATTFRGEDGEPIGFTDISDEVATMMEDALSIKYSGDGWRDIKEV